MRKLPALLILSLLLPPILSIGVSPARAATAVDCRSRVLTELAALLKADDGKILAAQFEVTTLKLATTLNGANEQTLESWLKTQSTTLAMKDSKKIREKLEKIYEIYGEDFDRKAFLEKMKGANYYKLPLRFTNAEASVYLRAHAALEKNSPFTRLDSAVLWAQSTISQTVTKESGRGDKKSNLTEVSTLAAQYTGMMDGLEKTSPKDLKIKLEAASKKVTELFRATATKFSAELRRDCDQCVDCAIRPADQEKLLADLFEGSQKASAPEEKEEEKKSIKRMAAVIKKTPKKLHVELQKTEATVDEKSVTSPDTTSIKTPVIPEKKVKPSPSSAPEDDSIDPSDFPNPTEKPAPQATEPAPDVKTSWSASEIKALSSQLTNSFLANPANRAQNVNTYRDGRLSSYLRAEDYPENNSKGLSRKDLVPQGQPIPENLLDHIRQPIPLSENALSKALEAYGKTISSGHYPNLKKGILTVIDFDQPSDAKRLYVVDIESGKVLYNTFTTHGGPSSEDVRHGEYTEKRPYFMPSKFSSSSSSPYSQTGAYATGKSDDGTLKVDHLNSKYEHTSSERSVNFHRDWRLQERTFFTSSNPITQDGSFGLPFLESGKFYGLEDRPLSDLIMDKIAEQSVVYVYSSKK